MRSAGGAGIGLFACLLGCATFPPPDPGPAPPPVAPPAPTASSPTPETAVEWDPTSGTIRCRSTRITVPETLREQVRWTNTDELAIVPAGEPAGGALVIGLADSSSDDHDAPYFVEDAALTWIRLQLFAGGGLLGPVDINLSGNTDLEDSRLVAEYTIGRDKGKAVYVQTEGCRIAALDFPLLGDHPPLTALLHELEARIRAQSPETFVQRRARARFDARGKAGAD